MRSAPRFGIGIAAVVVVAGCGGYAQPRPDLPHAELSIVSNRGSNPYGGVNSVNDFHAFAAPDCPRDADLGQLAKFSVIGDRPTTVRVAADARLYIRAHAIGTEGRGTMQYRNHCLNVFSFVPEPGRRYRLSQAVKPLMLVDGQPLNIPGVGGLVCSVTLLDEATGAPPESFELANPDLRCRP